MDLSPEQHELLVAVVNRLIPADDHPNGWDGGVGDFLVRQSSSLNVTAQIERAKTGLAHIAALCADEPFTEMSDERKDAVLREAEAHPGVAALIELTAEGYYSDPGNGGNRDARSWRMLGYSPGAAADGDAQTPTLALTPHMVADVEDEYDAVVIGAGAAGGIVACVLAEAGRRVLLLERGRWQSFGDVPQDHLRNHRFARYGHNTGPDLEGHPRVVVNPDDGRARVFAPHAGEYGNNAMGVGGGTRVYGAQAWRFLPDDFRMASKYGVPDGSSMMDWPIGYDDLEPWYERAEWEIGVAGDDDAPVYRGLRKRGYPMPPIHGNVRRTLMQQAAQKLGWSTAPAPLLINTTTYQGRPACVRCGACVGFACPSESKNGSHNTVIPRALATGRCTLLTQAQAQRVETDARGRVTGVSFFTEESGAVHHRTVRAKRVVVSCGAIESARLLLNSDLGNEHVGRHLQGHVYTGALGLRDGEPDVCEGPGVSLATCQFNHDNPGIIGGGLLANEFIKLPIIFWSTSLPPDLPRWGAVNKQHMRDYFLRTLHIYGPIHETPTPDARVTVDPNVKDRFGIPVARLSGCVHEESLRSAEFLRMRAEEWVRACGAKQVWSRPNVHRYLSGGQHQAGTCRMGDDPRTSATDPFGRVHGHDNLHVVDGSLHVTNGGFNPVLTIMALAYRCADAMLRD